MQRRNLLVSALSFAFPRLARGASIEWPRSLFSRSVVLFEACSVLTRVAACALALSPIRDTLSEGFSHFVTSTAAPVASGWSGCRVGRAPTGKARPFHGARQLRTPALHKRPLPECTPA